MSQQSPDEQVPTYDVVGVGFGPSNLALAIAVREHNQQAGRQDLTAAFVERQAAFGWHRGMLIDDATMQVSFMKDLVTLRNPTSEFSFLAYLHNKGRLVDFINQKSLFPLRVEFHDYLEWAAARFADQVAYGTVVTEIRPVTTGSTVELFDVVTRPTGGGAPTVLYRARNLVLGIGMEPNLPDGVSLGERVWHNRDLLSRVDTIAESDPARFAVVGAGQSAAEVAKYLHDRFPRAEICAVFSRYGYSPSDDSPFANRVFDPDAVDKYFTAPGEVKRMILDYHGNTNYSVVDPELIEELYARLYREKVLGAERLRIYNVARLVEVAEADGGVRATVESLASLEKTVLDCDVLVCATGYRPVDPARLLGAVGEWCRTDAEGNIRVARDYRVITDPALRAGLYLQGGTEHTHGISSSLLSNTVARTSDIVRSVLHRLGHGAATVDVPAQALGAMRGLPETRATESR
ncbi:L-ornithine N5-oxygenase [Tamaricihabitans halophyticus]|uniref:L-lysine N6-monooxygenase MbtG n=1 Tax=Tamaricihabitans halophyticus TaxID=1262583 RepID=A0A4R2QV71_9PSEU|nr:lysine N(6)-hydroxylase/L-ornithine N(5)-oxygenase family protein [Tamaricihabitans halophyticus]TCP53627.1 L-ornithine N5-oxygenase [Tamaricihabitans halophyticus]